MVRRGPSGRKKPWNNHPTIAQSLIIHLETTGLPPCGSNTWRLRLPHPPCVFFKAQSLAGWNWRSIWAAALVRRRLLCVRSRMHCGLRATNVPETFSPSRDASILSSCFEKSTILSPAYPDREADLIYCRFLLTHIHRPAHVVTTSVQHLRSGGRLLIEETAALFSPVPALSRYYDLVEQLQAHHGQDTLIGKRLGTLAAGVSGARTTSVLR